MKQVESQRPTVRELADRFIRDFIDVYLKPSTAINYRRHLADHILPVLGGRDFESVTRSDAQALHASLKHIPGSANYVLCVLGSLYKRITVDGDLSDMRIPSHGVRRFKMKTRERFLTPEERRHVEEVLLRGLQILSGRKGHLDRMSVWALQLLSLTGLRRDEIRDLAWPMVDWQHSCLNLPDTKTGQRNVPVPSQVMALLRQIHDRTGNRKEGLVVHSRTGRKLTGHHDVLALVQALVRGRDLAEGRGHHCSAADHPGASAEAVLRLLRHDREANGRAGASQRPAIGDAQARKNLRRI